MAHCAPDTGRETAGSIGKDLDSRCSSVGRELTWFQCPAQHKVAVLVHKCDSSTGEVEVVEPRFKVIF